ncbi:cyclic GMP-AMP synthase isoform X4 [Piliocolobus tephrosceles]|uniref:cyclic GMP-AMP synthase isoform X4 n=1 Tax=Piliocolobus tephrosceles TaxID=591936 RepID=UPI000C29838A|nr:cyclic GMP-AMP synthase isoform X4 [Piliocolobus tephrosceles]
MQPRHGKATRRASEAGATVPEASARSARGARTDPNESPAAPEAALPEAGKFGPARKSGSRQKKSPPDTQERSPVRATGARAKKVPQRAQDAGPSDATSATGAEGLEPPAARESAFSRAGSCRQRYARCSPKPRPPPGPWDRPSPDLPVSAPILVPPYDAAPGTRKLRAVLEKLRLSRLDLSSAPKVVNGVVGHLLHRLKFESGFGGVERLHTGSYYEHVKISAPNEFDVMFKLEVPRIQLEEYSNTGAYYFVKFKRNPKENPLSQFLEDEILSASKMLSKFRKIIKEEINNIKEETWRLSFSHIEKEILSNHGKSKTCCENKGMKCCRKDCLKLMKYLLEQLKEKFKDKKHLEKFSSYHVKTAFFYICTQNPEDSQWDPKDLGLCFDNCVTYFLECLGTEKLPNYFIPGFNLFSSDLIEKKSSIQPTGNCCLLNFSCSYILHIFFLVNILLLIVL